MGTSVEMLMSNYAQVTVNKDKEEYKGLGDLSAEEAEKEVPKQRSVWQCVIQQKATKLTRVSYHVRIPCLQKII